MWDDNGAHQRPGQGNDDDRNRASNEERQVEDTREQVPGFAASLAVKVLGQHGDEGHPQRAAGEQRGKVIRDVVGRAEDAHAFQPDDLVEEHGFDEGQDFIQREENGEQDRGAGEKREFGHDRNP